MVDLGDLPGGTILSFATDVSSDGFVVVGESHSRSGFEAFRWTPEGGMVGLGDLDGGRFRSSALAVSADGSVIVGFGTVSSGTQAVRWTRGGRMRPLGDLPGGAIASQAYDVSADGARIVGVGRTAKGNEAFLWDARGGMRNVHNLLVETHGLDLAGWTLLAATAVSADGRAMAGTGINPHGNQEAWLAVLPVREGN
jgi:probable HAF family extracellular repeat protein